MINEYGLDDYGCGYIYGFGKGGGIYADSYGNGRGCGYGYGCGAGADSGYGDGWGFGDGYAFGLNYDCN